NYGRDRDGRTIWAGIDCVCDYINEDLIQLVTVPMTHYSLAGEFLLNWRVFLVDFVGDQVETVPDQIVKIDIRLLECFAAGKLRNVYYQFVEVHYSPLDKINRPQSFVVYDVIAQHRYAQPDTPQRISNFMVHLGRCLAH